MAIFFPQTNDPNKTAHAMHPGNYVFIQANILAGMPFAVNSFDFVHERLLAFGVPTARRPDEFREAYRLVRPGGWVESVEADAFPQPQNGDSYQHPCQFHFPLAIGQKLV